ncbi:MAG: TetR/AcrR family transcriptional regulator [Devosia sp.]
MSTSDAPTGYHHGDLKRALLEAAFEMLDAEGTEGLGLRELARKVGVSPAAPYRHFRSRQALLEAVAIEGFRRFSAMMEAKQAHTPEPQQLVAMAEAYVRFALVQPALFRLMFSQQVDKRANKALHQAAIDAYASLAKAAAREVPEAPSEGAVIAWAFVHGLSMLLLDDQLLGVSPQNSDSLIRNLAQRFVAGLRTGVAPNPQVR